MSRFWLEAKRWVAVVQWREPLLRLRLIHSETVNPKSLENPVRCFEDNQGCIALAKNFMVTKRSKHIRIKYHYVRQQVEDNVISLEYVNTRQNIADLFTKILPECDFSRHMSRLVKEPVMSRFAAG